jgi:hypothetical protein
VGELGQLQLMLDQFYSEIDNATIQCLTPQSLSTQPPRKRFLKTHQSPS